MVSALSIVYRKTDSNYSMYGLLLVYKVNPNWFAEGRIPQATPRKLYKLAPGDTLQIAELCA